MRNTKPHPGLSTGVRFRFWLLIIRIPFYVVFQTAPVVIPVFRIAVDFRLGNSPGKRRFQEQPASPSFSIQHSAFCILYFPPMRILASSELPSRMTVFSSPLRLAFSASRARENS